MLFLTLFPPYESQLCHATFWLVILAWALLSVAVIWWLRKGLERLEVYHRTAASEECLATAP